MSEKKIVLMDSEEGSAWRIYAAAALTGFITNPPDTVVGDTTPFAEQCTEGAARLADMMYLEEFSRTPMGGANLGDDEEE